MTRTCADCPTTVSRRATRCIPCSNRAIARNPEVRAKIAARARINAADPEKRAAMTKRNRAITAAIMADPVQVERRRELGRLYGGFNIGATRSPDIRAKAGEAISSTKLRHIPAAYRDMYRNLAKQGHSAADRTRMVTAQITADEDRARASARSSVLARHEAMRARHERDLREAY
jgi:hypothetical protein